MSKIQVFILFSSKDTQETNQSKQTHMWQAIKQDKMLIMDI